MSAVSKIDCGRHVRWRVLPPRGAGKAGKTDIEILAFKDAGHFAFGAPLDASDPKYARLATLGGSKSGDDAALAGGLAQANTFLASALADQDPTPQPQQ